MVRLLLSTILLPVLVVTGCVSTGLRSSGDFGTSAIVRAFEDGKQAYDRHAFANAAPQFAAFLDTHPDTALAAPALYYLASCNKELGHFAMAEAQYQQVLKKYPSGIWHDVARYDLHYIRKHMRRD